MTATFDDVILQSQPAFYPDGADGAGTAGATWRWVLESPAGLDADWSGVVFACEILSPEDRSTVVLELGMTADVDNRITIAASAAETVALDATRIVVYPWRATATLTDDVVVMWTVDASEFTVFPSAADEGS